MDGSDLKTYGRIKCAAGRPAHNDLSRTAGETPAPLRRRHIFGAFAADDSGVSQIWLRRTRLPQDPPSRRLWRTRRTLKHVFLRNEPELATRNYRRMLQGGRRLGRASGFFNSGSSSPETSVPEPAIGSLPWKGGPSGASLPAGAEPARRRHPGCGNAANEWRSGPIPRRFSGSTFP
jgi:hypothetical protein